MALPEGVVERLKLLGAAAVTVTASASALSATATLRASRRRRTLAYARRFRRVTKRVEARSWDRTTADFDAEVDAVISRLLTGPAVDITRATAEYRDGVLRVRVPKVDEKRGRIRAIPVTAATSEGRGAP